jgi:MoaA/NifB/PqqE/SkfB family radical SAM enzyme
MKKRSILSIEVDSQGRAILPAELARRYGFSAGAKVRLEEDEAGFRFSRTTHNLARINIEPTNFCNLDCRICMRHVWDETPGSMGEDIYERILEGIEAIDPVPSVFFGGYGEPLTHSQICDMVARAQRAGAAVELITNGILLSDEMARRLMNAGLDRLWVSLDGATPESYADVRLGAALPEVIANLRHLKQLRDTTGAATPRLGIAFVAMKRNIAELPELVRLGKSLGADQFSISNVLPHTPDLRDEILYMRSLNESDFAASEWVPLIALPRLDIDSTTGEKILDILKNRHLISIARQEIDTGANRCPFVEKASLSIRWDGAISPCLALLHTHTSYLGKHVHKSNAFAFGSLAERSLISLWNDSAYQDMRERLLRFDFSPCATCNSCEMADANAEDCFGNTLPACGGCLWAQGFIQCP